ncbi:MAG: 16S rRNA (cytidine(1402)-2'-O)-methyltransferase [Gemmatimonadota bacterium]|nr:16S rRNA (cytidine(1402)-2'-O)-methyltransferase [Gemmatimonadota bacterium]
MTIPAAGSLYVVSTPIGNLSDMTFRAVEVLSSAALVVAEDTRHSRHLFNHFKITTPLKSYHEHNEARETPALVARMLAGDSIALITDAGTPLVSDPGARLVAAAAEAGVRIVPIPGASSVLAALVGAGLPSDRFLFIGFLERKGRSRKEEIERVVSSDVTVVLFESANRLHATLADFAAAGAGERRIVVARELTKQFEEFRRGTVAQLEEAYRDEAPKGEVVILMGGEEPARISDEELEKLAGELIRGGASPRTVMDRLIHEHGTPRNAAYKLAHELSAAEAGGAATKPTIRVTKRDEHES